MRGVTTATGQAGKKRPQATPQEGAGTEELDKDEEEDEEGAKYSDTEESESDEEPTPLATKLLRQLRGAFGGTCNTHLGRVTLLESRLDGMHTLLFFLRSCPHDHMTNTFPHEFDGSRNCVIL